MNKKYIYAKVYYNGSEDSDSMTMYIDPLLFMISLINSAPEAEDIDICTAAYDQEFKGALW